MRGRVRVAAAAGAVLVAASVWWSLRTVTADPVEWSEAARGDLVLRVEVTGTLKAVRTKMIGPPQLPNVWQLKIAQIAPEGSSVTAGTPILGFDTSELQQRLQREKAERDAARKRLEKADREEEVRRRQDRMRLAESKAKLRKASLQAAAPEELEAANELALVKLDLELAEKEVDYLTSRLDSAERSAEARLAALRDQLQRAEQQVVWTQRDIEALTVKAERDGTVVYVSNWNDEKKKIGDSVWKGESILELPDLTEMKAMGAVHESDAGRIAEGQRVTLRLDAHPEKEFPGEVASIWRTVERETWRTPKRVMRLEIVLDETDEQRMRPGMRFRGEIEVERVPDALLVDAESVFLAPEGPVVYRRSRFGPERVRVDLGRRNATRVEVLGGLREGDAVALEDLGKAGAAT